jgi:hypothetical protein
MILTSHYIYDDTDLLLPADYDIEKPIYSSHPEKCREIMA